MQEARRERQTNIELLRVVAMLMIIAHHLVIHSGFPDPEGTFLANRIWLRFLRLLGKMGVNLFVLITGYFMACERRGEGASIAGEAAKRIKKILRIFCQTAFYSLVPYAILCGVGLLKFSFTEWIQATLPVLYYRRWFASAYFVLLLITPYLNRMIDGMEKEDLLKLLFSLGMFFCLLPTFTKTKLREGNAAWFGFLYCLAGYLRRWAKLRGGAARYLGLAALCLLLSLTATMGFDVLGTRWSPAKSWINHLSAAPRLSTLSVALFLLLGFSRLEIRQNRWINKLGALTFGVYLFHDEDCVRVIIWKKVLRATRFFRRRMLIPFCLGATLLVFVVGAILELLRARLLERHYMGALGKLADRLAALYVRIGESSFLDRL